MYRKKFFMFFVSLILFTSLISCQNVAPSKIYGYEEISYQKFQEKINNQMNFYVIFERDDCPACPTFIEDFSQIAEDNEISFFIINTNKLTDNQKDICRKKYNLEYVPTAMYFEFGKPINKLIGTDDVKEIQNFQKRHLD